MNRRRLLVRFGLLLFGIAIVELLGVDVLPVPGSDIVVPILGVLVLLYAYFVHEWRSVGDTSRAATPDPELSVRTSPPGGSVKSVLEEFPGRDRLASLTETSSGLRTAAIAVLTRYEGLSASEARQRLADGTWTDDRYAAAFLRPRDGDADAALLRSTRFRKKLPGSASYRRNVRHTVDAIAAVAGCEPATDDAGVIRRWLPLSTDTDTVVEPAATAERVRDPTTAGPEAGESSSPRIAARRSTRHWYGVSLVALLALGVGLLVERPAVLLAGIVGVGYAAYAHAARLETVELSVERSVSDTDPEPGDEVDVTVTITNEGSQFCPDVRIVDGVPPALAVSDGSPRCGTALRPGESTSFSYAVTARRGRHSFRQTLVAARNLSGTVERELYVAAETTLRCIPPLSPTQQPIPLRAQTTRYSGVVETDTGGAGVAFHATREYRPGDALNRIDWHRRARTGELATLEFQQERAALVVVVVDVQPSAYVSPEPDSAHAVDRSVAAARRVFTRLLDDGHRVGIATVGPRDCWLPPAAGSEHRVEGRQLLATDPALSSIPPEATGNPFLWRRRLRRRLPADAQVILFSPLADAQTLRTIRRLEADGHPTTVVSPDATADRTLGQRLARVRRTVAMTDLRGDGVPVIDWPATDSLEETLATSRHHPNR